MTSSRDMTRSRLPCIFIFTYLLRSLFYELGKFSVFPVALRFGLLEWVIYCLSVVQLSYFYCCFLSVVPYPCEFMPLKNSLCYGFGEVQEKAKLVVCIQSVILAKNSHYIFYMMTLYECFCSVVTTT